MLPGMGERIVGYRLLLAVSLAAAGLATAGGSMPAVAASCLPGAPGAVSFAYSGGEACYTVGPRTTRLRVAVIGAAGHSGPVTGGDGASVTADLTVVPGQTLYVEVGGTGDAGGFGGGGLQSGLPSGGGASDVRTCPIPCPATPLTGHPASDPRLVVGGGGGGPGAQNGPLSTGGPGGSGGETGGDGGDGTAPSGAGTGGHGGSAGAGGAGGGRGPAGLAGAAGVGADAPTTEGTNGGAGGGGWFGGGSGGAGPGGTGTAGGGGGGGSSYGPAGSVFAVAHTAAQVEITAPGAADATPPSVSIASPVDGARYPAGQSVVALYACHDPDGPGDLASCAGPVATGAALDTTSLGVHFFEVDATDGAGNRVAETVSYTVLAPVVSAGVAPTPPPAVGALSAPTPPPGPASPGAPTAVPPAATPPASAPPATPSPPVPAGGAPRSPRAAPPPAAGSAATPATHPATPAAAAAHGLPRYDPRSEPKKVVGLGVVAYTLLELGAGGGLALVGLGASGLVGGAVGRGGASGGGASPAAGKRPAGGSVAGAATDSLGRSGQGLAAGDRSATWRWPGTGRVDTGSRALALWLAPRSPLAARLVADGGYLRSILGSASVLFYAGGLALGAAAVADVHGQALPPSTLLTFAAIVLGIVDAAAGFAAAAAFAAGVVLHGGVDSAPALRTLLGLGALWFVVPLLVGAARPLRRPPSAGGGERFDRGADFVIGSLIGAWAVAKIIAGLPGLAGYRLPIAGYANEAAVVVLVAVAARLAAESLAIRFYPERLATVQPPQPRAPGTFQRLVAIGLRTALFVFVATVVVGPRWQLWVGAGLFALPQVLTLGTSRWPNSPRLFRLLPRGLLKLVVMLFVGTAVGLLVTSSLRGSRSIIEDSFVLLALPGLTLSLLGLVGRDGSAPATSWRDRGAGSLVLVAGLGLVLGYITL